jgi:ferredoxin
VELAPDFWRMSRKDGKSVLLGATEKKGNYILKIAESDKAANLRAAEACPVKIIEVRD